MVEVRIVLNNGKVVRAKVNVRDYKKMIGAHNIATFPERVNRFFNRLFGRTAPVSKETKDKILAQGFKKETKDVAKSS